MLGKRGLPVWVSIDSPAVSGLVAVDCRGLASGQRAGSDGLMMGDGGRKAQAVFVMPVRSVRSVPVRSVSRLRVGRATAFCKGLSAKERGMTAGR